MQCTILPIGCDLGFGHTLLSTINNAFVKRSSLIGLKLAAGRSVARTLQCSVTGQLVPLQG